MLKDIFHRKIKQNNNLKPKITQPQDNQIQTIEELPSKKELQNLQIAFIQDCYENGNYKNGENNLIKDFLDTCDSLEYKDKIFDFIGMNKQVYLAEKNGLLYTKSPCTFIFLCDGYVNVSTIDPPKSLCEFVKEHGIDCSYTKFYKGYPERTVYRLYLTYKDAIHLCTAPITQVLGTSWQFFNNRYNSSDLFLEDNAKHYEKLCAIYKEHIKIAR